MTAAIFWAASGPPTMQTLGAALPATTALAAAEQPAYPQPPQLAPAVKYSTSAMRGELLSSHGIAFSKLFIGTTSVAGATDPYKMFWGKSLFEGKDNHILHALHEIPGWVGWAPFMAMAAGFALAYVYYIAAPWLPAATARTFRPLYLFLLNKWYFDELYDWIFVRPANAIGRMLWKRGDGAVIDGAIDGTAAGVGRVTGRVVKLQSGYIYHYAFAMLIGLAAIITWFIVTQGTGGAR